MQKRTRSEKASGFLKRYPLCFAALTSRLSAGVGIGASLVRDAEKNERCAKKERLRMSFENVEMILQKSKMYLEEHGGKSPFAK